MAAPRRVQLEPAWLLHHRPYSDTSRILDLATRNHGRVSLFARGARGPKSKLAGILQPFRPLLVSWSGRADGGSLAGAELAGPAPVLPAAELMSGFYLNELMVRLLPRDEGHAELFDRYGLALAQLAEGEGQRALRSFEMALLDELGYGLDLQHEAGSGAALQADRYYAFHPGRGLVLAVQDSAGEQLCGADLLALAGGQLGELSVMRVARRVLRGAIGHCLEGRSLKSREVMLALRRQEQDA